jgi:hypothetical protein
VVISGGLTLGGAIIVLVVVMVVRIGLQFGQFVVLALVGHRQNLPFS